jgi:hypothetical protein
MKYEYTGGHGSWGRVPTSSGNNYAYQEYMREMREMEAEKARNAAAATAAKLAFNAAEEAKLLEYYKTPEGKYVKKKLNAFLVKNPGYPYLEVKFDLLDLYSMPYKFKGASTHNKAGVPYNENNTPENNKPANTTPKNRKSRKNRKTRKSRKHRR